MSHLPNPNLQQTSPLYSTGEQDQDAVISVLRLPLELWLPCHLICSSWTLLFLYQCTDYFTYLYIHIYLKHAPDSYYVYLQIFPPFICPGSACATYYIYHIESAILGCYTNILHCTFLYIHIQYILYVYALLPNCVETKCNKLYSVAAH